MTVMTVGEGSLILCGHNLFWLKLNANICGPSSKFHGRCLLCLLSKLNLARVNLSFIFGNLVFKLLANIFQEVCPNIVINLDSHVLTAKVAVKVDFLFLSSHSNRISLGKETADFKATTFMELL